MKKSVLSSGLTLSETQREREELNIVFLEVPVDFEVGVLYAGTELEVLSSYTKDPRRLLMISDHDHNGAEGGIVGSHFAPYGKTVIHAYHP